MLLFLTTPSAVSGCRHRTHGAHRRSRRDGERRELRARSALQPFLERDHDRRRRRDGQPRRRLVRAHVALPARAARQGVLDRGCRFYGASCVACCVVLSC